MQFMHKTMLALPLLIAAPAAVPHLTASAPLAAHERSALSTSAAELENLRARADHKTMIRITIAFVGQLRAHAWSRVHS